jgi:outer membrane protein OmpA-like peptidoglycan-associated protein
MKTVARLLALAVFGMSLSTAATAQSGDVDAIIRSLAPIAEQTRKPDRERDILVAPAERSVERLVERPVEVRFEVVVENVVLVVDPAYAIDIEVFFPFDSAALTREARASLHALGRALESPDLRPFSYLVAGHTDARGRASYNKALSERRAAAVREFLLREYAIEPWRLASIGFGQERLRTPQEPYAAINRRVEVLLVRE